jgi:hypothetical protein
MFSSGAPLAAADESATKLENLDLTQVGVVDPDKVETVGGLANPSGIATDPRDHRYPRVVTHDYLPLIVTDAVLFEITWTLDQDHGR